MPLAAKSAQGRTGMHSSGIPIWFFIGLLLTIYGAMIVGYGIYEAVTGNYANVQLVHLHAPLWWGGVLLLLGLFYCVKFRPGRGGK
jgi:hypothetical protein